MSSGPITLLLHDLSQGQWLRFERPIAVLQARSLKEVAPCLEELDQRVEQEGRLAIGWISYEAAPAFDSAFQVRNDTVFPLAWFVLYKESEVIPRPPLPSNGFRPVWKPEVDFKRYREGMRQIREHIQHGETYQVNFTMRLRGPAPARSQDLFASMIDFHKPQYAAFIDTESFSVCSASPELFFRLNGTELSCRPMKGTAPRGLWPDDDLFRGEELRTSAKNQAENLMIVDMVRNDLGRIAEPGTVEVPALFDVEKYPTLWQMTSTVRCRTSARLPKIFRALFPAASITGAPKVRTTRIIAELEQSPRRIYTGAIGFLRPGRQAQFSVAIRTALVDKVAGTAEYGIGSGITWDSRTAAEFQECMLKSKILRRRSESFELIETILWEPAGGYFLLQQHLARLVESADYFSWKVDVSSLKGELFAIEKRFAPEARRVRVAVASSGTSSIVESPVAEPADYRITLARKPINRTEPFLYHKTSRRHIYERALAASPGYQDVLLWNEAGELTESTIANIALELDGQLLTPPVRCGLLGGTYRAFLLEQKRIREEVLRVEDLDHASRLCLINSVRRMWEPVFSKNVKVEQPQPSPQA